MGGGRSGERHGETTGIGATDPLNLDLNTTVGGIVVGFGVAGTSNTNTVDATVEARRRPSPAP
jgi:hypothetical protein